MLTVSASLEQSPLPSNAEISAHDLATLTLLAALNYVPSIFTQHCIEDIDGTKLCKLERRTVLVVDGKFGAPI